MSFQKLAALVTLVVFASQGAMAAPSPSPPPPPAAASSGPQNIADNLLGNIGKALGTAGSGILPANFMKNGIQGAGGIAPGGATYPQTPTAAPSGLQNAADDLVGTAGKIAGTTAGATLPNSLLDPGIEGAGGTVAREEDVEF